jgi:hypothetical protein
MLHFRLCYKCKQGVIQTAKESEDGELEVRPSVFCKLVGHLLFMKDDPPEECPYAMEHLLVTQDADSDFVDWMSGHRSDE